jgi:hypothetical protein
VLEAFVDCVVRSEEKAVNALDELFPRLSHVIQLRKKDGKTTTFDRRKLKRSLRAALNQTGCDDSLLLSKLLKESHRRITKEAKQNHDIISTSDIRRLVFEVLVGFSSDEQNKDLAVVTLLLKEKWGDYELKKGDVDAYDQLSAELGEYREARDAAELEVQNLRAIMASFQETLSTKHAGTPASVSIEDRLELRNADSLLAFVNANPSAHTCA